MNLFFAIPFDFDILAAPESLTERGWIAHDQMLDLHQELAKHILNVIRISCTKVQSRRVVKHIIEQKTFKTIAEEENVSTISVYYSIYGRKNKQAYAGALNKIKAACERDPTVQKYLQDIKDLQDIIGQEVI